MRGSKGNKEECAVASDERLRELEEKYEGFTVYEPEWWHFDYKDWRQYPILDLSFLQLRKKSHTK